MPQQLDIFDHSQDVGLRNDLAQALLGGEPDKAQSLADALAAGWGDDPVLPPASLLIDHLRWQQACVAPGRMDLATLRQARSRLEGPMAVAAAAALGAAQAPGWLASQWRWLAGQAGDIAWQASHSDAHAAALYLRAQAWHEAAVAVATIEAWRRIPQPLLWMAQARWRGQGADAAWPLLAEALWLAPARAAALLPALADQRLERLVSRFEEQFDTASGAADLWAWLPAFVLIEQPLLAGVLAPASVPAESAPAEAFSTMMALLRLERQGRHHEIVAHRARLRLRSAPLFAAYMATR